ncbi:Tox-REase-5 domain-containing protein [Morganella sp. GD04133]|uniref:Tox-REase-5 domain-containing protein n=1 Tax=Morganella sp. GD04133 TaxID=2975435 RepID=UPI00244C3A0B|nr:Tox-REase-5 domain-containing protein [Morganella sp. GD04133]MDH0353586.1 restriction endonuclease fold toxin 5 domain-containing protein [Morganella sp. GD04133]
MVAFLLPVIAEAIAFSLSAEGVAAVTAAAATIAILPSDEELQERLREHKKRIQGISIEDLPIEEQDKINEANSVILDTAVVAIAAAEISTTKACEDCPAENYIVPVPRKITRTTTPDSYLYQSIICNSQITETYSPDGSRETYIGEWECTVIPPMRVKPVDFDGWKPEECNFIETKYNFDNFFDKDGIVKKWWKSGGGMKSQAESQNWLCANLFEGKSYVDWHFGTENIYNFASELLLVFNFIRTNYTPINNLNWSIR